jgi:hypothetical protein
MAVGSATQIPGNPDVFGGTLFNAIDYVGPTSYVNGTGDQISSSMFGFFNGFKDINANCIDTTGTYLIRKQMAAPGGLNAPFYLRWYTLSNGNEVVNGANLSAYKVRLSAFGY